MLPKQEVGCKNADEREILLAAQPHDCEGCLHAHGEFSIPGALHVGDL